MLFKAGPLVLLLISAVPAILSCDNTDRCVVNCTGCIGNNFVPDPDDCRGYYFCVGEDQIEVPFQCDEDEMFDPATGSCVLGECEESCFYKSCHYECMEDSEPVHGSIADHYDCSRYTYCNIDGTEGPTFTCPAQEPFFDGKECQTDETRCCACRPYCSQADIGFLVIDPADCTKYFICQDIGVPEIWGKCDPGEHFDHEEGRCSETMPCVTLCTNVPDHDGCINVFTCEEVGYFTKCRDICTAEFYFCGYDDIHTIVEATSCKNGEIFHPNDHKCVHPSECPF